MNKIIIALAVIASANPAWAMQNIKLGTVEINPVASINQAYDTNIYLAEKGAGITPVRESFINRAMAGVNVANKFGPKLELTGGYNLELLTYSRAASTNNAVHHSGNLAVKALLPRDTTLTVQDNAMDTTDQATSELTQRARRVQNTAMLNVESPLRGKFGFGIMLQHNYNNYMAMANNALDRAELLAGLNITYQLQPKTKVFVGYTYGTLNYLNDAAYPTATNDATYNNIDLGVTGNIAPKLVGTVKAGVQMRNYDKSFTYGSIKADNDLNTAAYSAQLAWNAMEKTDVVILAKRANVESNFQASRFYTSTLTDLSASREVRKVKVGVGVNYEDVLYPEKSTLGGKRHDNMTSARLTADYNIQKWLKAGFNYTFKYRTSNYTGADYKDSLVGLEVKGMF